MIIYTSIDVIIWDGFAAVFCKSLCKTFVLREVNRRQTQPQCYCRRSCCFSPLVWHLPPHLDKLTDGGSNSKLSIDHNTFMELPYTVWQFLRLQHAGRSEAWLPWYKVGIRLVLLQVIPGLSMFFNTSIMYLGCTLHNIGSNPNTWRPL